MVKIRDNALGVQILILIVGDTECAGKQEIHTLNYIEMATECHRTRWSESESFKYMLHPEDTSGKAQVMLRSSN